MNNEDTGELFDKIRYGKLECDLISAESKLKCAQEDVDEIKEEMRLLRREMLAA